MKLYDDQPKCVFSAECDRPVIHELHPVCHDHTVDLIVAIVQATPKRCTLAKNPEPE